MPLLQFYKQRKNLKVFKIASIATLLFVTLILFVGMVRYQKPQITMLDVIDANILSILGNLLVFCTLIIFTIIIPGKLLLRKSLNNGILAYFSAFILFFLLLFIRQRVVLKIDAAIYLIYTLFALFYLLQLGRRKISISINFSFIDKRLLAGILLFLVAFSYWLFVMPPFYDELYRAQFIVSTMNYSGNENILFFPDGGTTNYYILLELLVGQISELINLNYKIVYFIFFPLTTLVLIFIFINRFVQSNTKLSLLIPILFIAALSFYWQAANHLFLRQTANGTLFFLITIYIYNYYTTIKTLKERVMIATLLGFSLFFVFYSKGMFGYATFPIILLIEVFRKKKKSKWGSLPLFIALASVVIVISLGFRMDGDGLTLSFSPLFNFLARSAHHKDYFNPYFTAHIPVKPRLLFIIIHFTITYVLVFNFQLWFIFKGIGKQLKLLLNKQFQHHLQNNIVEVMLLTITISCFVFYNLFTISKYKDTGGADNYFLMLMFFSSTIYTFIQIAKIKTGLKYILIIGVLIVSILPLKHSFIDGGLGSLKDKELLSALKFLEQQQNGVVIHNLYEDKQSVAISALTPHKQYMSYIGYGGVSNQPKQSIQNRIENIHNMMNGESPEHYIISTTTCYILKKYEPSSLDKIEQPIIYKNSQYIISQPQPQPQPQPQLSTSIFQHSIFNHAKHPTTHHSLQRQYTKGL